MYLAIALGLGLGALIAYFGSRRITTLLGGGIAIHRGSSFGALMAAFPGFFLAFVAGGNIGGGYSDILLGTPVPGAAIGMMAVFAVVTLCGSVVGAAVGRICTRSV